jgi:hypothetical protein
MTLLMIAIVCSTALALASVLLTRAATAETPIHY